MPLEAIAAIAAQQGYNPNQLGLVIVIAFFLLLFIVGTRRRK